ncbi:MAG: signal transduction histidine kinase [Acidimicrobiales bacterium]
MTALLHPPRISPPTRDTLLRGILAYRWLVAVWLTIVFLFEIWDRSRDELKVDVAHPAAGVAMVLATLGFTALLTWRYHLQARHVVRPLPVLSEIALAALLLFLDSWVYGTPHSQALPTVWPIAVIFTTAIAAGTRLAVVTGLGLGLARYAGWLAFPFASNDSVFSSARIASTVLFAVAGWVAGYLLNQQERSDREISAFRAREEVARTLHDGVLQTLAVIQRRSGDEQLVDLARTQEHELREYLFGATTTEADVASALRAAARRAEQRYGLKVEVVSAPDLQTGSEDAIHALGGAVGEALTNAAKHGGATKATVYAEPANEMIDGGIFVSVKDDGSGFDTATVSEGEGLRRSVRGRVADIGGRVEIDGRPGRGTEVRMWI